MTDKIMATSVGIEFDDEIIQKVRESNTVIKN